MTSHLTPPGKTIIDGTYELRRLLGKVGMAYVYEAYDRKLSRRVAIKFFARNDTVAPGDGAIARFQREFQINSKLRHPNIVRLYHFGVLENSNPFYVLEYIDGPSLLDVLSKGPVDIPRAERIITQLCGALAALHDASIIHRDLKPANVMLDQSGIEERTVLMDFGLAKVINSTDLTATGAIVGTPFYLSPEVINGSNVVPQSDIFQLGILIYEVFTRRRPFEGTSLADIVSSVLRDSPPPLLSLAVDVPRKWQEIAFCCLEKSPSHRYRNAGQLLEAIKSLEDKSSSVITDRLASSYRKNLYDNKDDNGTADTSPVNQVTQARKLTFRKAFLFSALMFFSTLIVFLFANALRRSARVYSVESFNVAASPISLVVTWKSDTAYPSAVSLNGVCCTKTFNKGGTPETEHNIRIGSLKPGTQYRLSILFPDGGKSLPRRVSTSSIEFTLLSSATPDGDLALTVSSQCFVAHSITLIDELGGRSTVNKAMDGRFIIRSRDALSAAGLVFNGKINASCNWKLDLATHLSNKITSLNNSMCRLSPEKIVSSLTRLRIIEPEIRLDDVYSKNLELRKDPDFEKRWDDSMERIRIRLSKTLSDLFRKTGTSAVFLEANHLSELVLGTRILALPVRLEFYHNLQREVKLRVYSQLMTFQFNDLIIPHLGNFTVSRRPFSKSADVVIPVFAGDALNLGFNYPMTHYRRLRFTQSFTINIKSSGFHSSELEFTCNSFKRICFSVCINDSCKGILYDRPIFDDQDNDNPVKLYMRAPPSVWRKGVNKLSISVSSMVEKHICDEAMELKHISLRLYR